MGVTTVDNITLGLMDADTAPTREKAAVSQSQAEKAHAVLKRLWLIKLMVDAVLSIGLIVVLATATLTVDTVMVPALIAACVGLWTIQAVSVFGLYTGKVWSLWLLHVFALVSLINIPVGLVMSAIHFWKARQVRF